MSNMLKIGDIINLSDEELREKESGLRKELMQLRFQAKTGKLERQTAMKEVKRSIARILTVLSQRRVEEALAGKAVSVKKVKPAAAKKEKAEVQKNVKTEKLEAKARKVPVKTEKIEGKAKKASVKTSKSKKG